MRSNVRSRALAALRDARVAIVQARCVKAAGGPPDEVIAKVTLSRPDSTRVYVIDFMDGSWTCTCRLGEGCAHIAAVQLVTGHQSAAAKAGTESGPCTGQVAALTGALHAVTHEHAPLPDEVYDFCWCELSRFAPIHYTPRVVLTPWRDGVPS